MPERSSPRPQSPICLEIARWRGHTSWILAVQSIFLKHVPNGDVVRKPIAAILACLLSCSSVAAAEPALLLPSAVRVPEIKRDQRPLALEALREEIRIVSRDGSLQRAAQQSPPENKSWMERHPVWFGLIVGAGVGAAWGAASCSDGCFPIGAGGAAIVGSWYGAGAGALIGWGVGRAR
jgi:hypothetical protein